MPKRQRTKSSDAGDVVDFASYDEQREARAAELKYQKTGIHPTDGLNMKKGVTPVTNNVGALHGFGGGAGFADAMNKLLGPASKATSSFSSSTSSSTSSSKSSPIIMSKRKTPNMRQIEEERDETRLEKRSRQERAALDQIKRSRPSVKSYNYEKELKKIATRGVVALFNAVSEAQKPAEDENVKVAKDMDKSDFLDMLQEKTKAGSAAKATAEATGTEDATPSYLRDDFMTGASMKHWDQEDEEESDNGEMGGDGPEESDSDSSSDSD
jgi:hypothetical protein